MPDPALVLRGGQKVVLLSCPEMAFSLEMAIGVGSGFYRRS